MCVNRLSDTVNMKRSRSIWVKGTSDSVDMKRSRSIRSDSQSARNRAFRYTHIEYHYYERGQTSRELGVTSRQDGSILQGRNEVFTYKHLNIAECFRGCIYEVIISGFFGTFTYIVMV